MSGIVALILHRRVRNHEKEKLRMQTMIRNKRFRNLSNPYEDPNFHSTYRLTPDLALAIVNDLKPIWQQHQYSSSLPIELKLLCALHFFAQGSYQKSLTKDVDFKVSQPNSSRAIKEAVATLNQPKIIKKWINFSNRPQMEATVLRNYQKFGIPEVLGYIDGTHIKLKKPTQHEELYVNRKGEHTLNAQMVCDSSLKILNVCARYPDATHDSFIWRFSALRKVMMYLNGEGNTCWLLGDSGYPLEPCLLTPILNAEENTPQSQYTNTHIRSRNSIERCFGVLKSFDDPQ
ncbi:unnamed protein product [Parnassius apollo]|uniref:(apollo) hypothetical protein n=1 Tax=Parnassius apollo TaxID=110799 RepID=A0A8S3WK49_PARAO|nr:unnamed protein product [Parnassius apollo]